MERTVIIDAQVNTGNSVEDLEKVAQGFDDVADASSKSNSQTQKQFDDLNKKIDKGGLSVRDYSKAIKEYTSIALAAGRTSPIGVEALNRAAQMKDELGDLKNEVTRLGADGRKLQASLQLGGTVVAGYQAFTGVTAMLGVENESLLKTMTMLQAAQGTLQAIETVRLALEKESILMIELRNAKTKVATALQTAFNAVMSANPMGLVIIAIGALVAGLGILVSKLGGVSVVFNAIGKVASSVIDGIVAGIDYAISAAAGLFDILTLGLFDASGAYSDYKKSVNDANKAEKERIDTLNKQIEASKEVIKEQENIIKIHQKAADDIQKERDLVVDRYDKEIELANAAGLNTQQLEMEKLEYVRQSTLAQIAEIEKVLAAEIIVAEEKRKIYEAELDKYKSGPGFLSVSEKLDAQAAEGKVSQTKKTLGELTTLFDDTEHSINLKSAENQKAANDAFAKSEETKTAKLKEEGEKRKELQRQLEDQIAANIKDADERAITQLQLKHQRERDALIEKYGKESALLAQLERIQLGERNKLLDEIEAGDAEAKKLRDEKKLAAEKENVGIFTKTTYDALVDSNEKKKQLDAEEVQAKQNQLEAVFKVAQASINGLRSIGEMAIKDQEKALKFSAVMTASQMALDSAKAITGAVSSVKGIPFPANIPAIATAVAAVLGNIATAVKAFKQAKVGSAPSVSTPSASGVGASSNASENEVVRRGANGETFTGEQPALTRPPMARVSVLNSELQMVRQEQEAIVEQSTL
jgi:hypothetical protein